MIPVFTLVPAECFSEESAYAQLSKVVPLSPGEPLSFLEIAQYDAVLIFPTGNRPRVYDMMMSLCKIREHNKILFHLENGVLSLVIAQGEDLKLCNCFAADDFQTALYYIFLSIKQFQINPELSVLYSISNLTTEQTISICSYFKSAEVLQ